MKSLVPRGTEWEDVVRDFLETGCVVKSGKGEPLIGALRREGIGNENVEEHAAFSFGKCVVIVLERTVEAKECWLYMPSCGKIRKSPDGIQPARRRREKSFRRRERTLKKIKGRSQVQEIL